jgi:hypothetical protein
MRVGRVRLQVVAPARYYHGHSLGWLEGGLNRAMQRFAGQKTSDLAMGFEFLATEFELPFCNGAEVKAACAANPPSEVARQVCDLFDNLSPAWPKVSTT